MPMEESGPTEMQTPIPESTISIHGPFLLDCYIKIIPHPHSRDPTPLIIPLAFSFPATPSILSHQKPEYISQLGNWPWTPFATLADFEYTEMAVKGFLSREYVNQQLSSFNSCWAIGGSHITLQNYTDMEKALHQARRYIVQVCLSQICFIFNELPFSLNTITCLFHTKAGCMTLTSNTAILGSIL
jgi:hypothetical protein